jgi:hypothetical protein
MNCNRCPAEAVYRPVLLLRTASAKKPRRAAFKTIGLCEQHKDAAKASDFLSTSTWDRIVRYLCEAGKPAPARNATTLDFELIVESPTNTEELPF